MRVCIYLVSVSAGGYGTAYDRSDASTHKFDLINKPATIESHATDGSD